MVERSNRNKGINQGRVCEAQGTYVSRRHRRLAPTKGKNKSKLTNKVVIELDYRDTTQKKKNVQLLKTLRRISMR
jgi:hypothetical protein